jgi:hypothetical protein
LTFILHDQSISATNASFDSVNAITRTSFHIPAEVPFITNFGGIKHFNNTEYEFPKFIVQGKGQLALIDVFRSYFHPLPDIVVESQTTSWMQPVGIADLKLTIVGVAVPEPSADTQFAALLLLVTAVRPRIRQ